MLGVVEVELDPQPARIVTAMALATQVRTLLRRYVSSLFLERLYWWSEQRGGNGRQKRPDHRLLRRTDRVVRLGRTSVALSLAALLVGAGAVGLAWWLTQRGHGPPAGKVVVSYEPGPPADEQLLRGAFAPAVSKLNSELGLSQDLQVRVVGPVTAAKVGASGALYDPEDHTVYIPWAFVEQTRTELAGLPRSTNPTASPDQVLSGAMTFVLYHETAHGVIDLLDVPSTGGEEADADSFATVVAIASGPNGQTIPLAGAEYFAAQPQEPQNLAALAAADYELPQQRYFDLQCLVYGSNPARNANLVGGDLIPRSQAQTCVFSYRREARSWQRLLGPELRQALWPPQH
jgi:hypothetical protein